MTNSITNNRIRGMKANYPVLNCARKLPAFP